jgi:DNA-binding transcriptional LysR family regulator
MDLGRLRTLRELSIRKTMAAVSSALLLSPSAISQQIAQLEDEAGVPLVERRGRGVRLTAAGERLVAHAEKIIAVLEEAKTDLAELKRVVSGELRVAAFPSVAAALIPKAMEELQKQHPQLLLTIEELEPMDGLAALRAWQTDVALVDDLTVSPGIPEATIESVHILDDRLYVILPKSHWLASRNSTTIEDLRNERWAIDTASNAYSSVIVKACHAVGFDPVINGKCNGFEVVCSLIEAGCSVSILPGLMVRNHQERVCIKKLNPQIRRKISAAFRRGERRNPAIAALLRELERSANLLDARFK